MDKKISADTITAITSSGGFAPADAPLPPPSSESLIESARRRLQEQVERARARAFAANDNTNAAGENNTLNPMARFERAQDRQCRFEEMLKEVPEGFSLMPVLYSKISQDDNSRIQAEYLFHVRPRFLKHIAENFEDDLRKLGICDHGIARMKKGQDPADAAGRLYHVSVDHIIERSGSGLWIESKEQDPDQPPQASPKFRTNHFGNLIFLPDQVHQFKNELNNMQGIGDIKPGESRWILMMVPVRDENHNGFVCPPQPQHHSLHGVAMRPYDPFQKIGHASFLATQASEAVEALRRSPAVEKLLVAFDIIAKKQETTVVGLARREKRSAAVRPGPGLAQIFNDIAAYDPEAAGHIDAVLRPILEDVAAHLRDTFDEFSGNRKTSRDASAYSDLAQFLRGKNLRRLKEQTSFLPLDEAVSLHDVLASIERDMDHAENTANRKFPPQRLRIRHNAG